MDNQELLGEMRDVLRILAERQLETQDQINLLTQRQNENERQINLLITSQQDVIETQKIILENQAVFSSQFERFLEKITQMQSEIKGLQTENQRIIKHLFNDT
jgi:hypothetical protein